MVLIIIIYLEDKKSYEIDNVFKDVEIFYQENKIEVLNILCNEKPEEMFEIMRIYIERVLFFVMFRMEDLLIIT